MTQLSALVRELGGTLRTARGADPARRDPEVRRVVLDSRRASSGALFAALRGTRDDGLRFAPEATERGAVALLTESDRGDAMTGLPVWIHPRARAVAGEAASAVVGHPSRAFFTAAVTGTNGKTTTAWLAGQLLASAGRVPAVLGTVSHRLAGGVEVPADSTMPDACALHELLARHREQGGDCVVLEASSHGLDQERHAGLAIDAAVFTNLTRDHLDYHGSPEAYALAKERLFQALAPGATAVVNAGDAAGERMANAARARGARVVTYGVESRADIRAFRLRAAPGGQSFAIDGLGVSESEVLLPLLGRHNAENALAALAAALASGASPSALVEGLATVTAAPGRLEPIDTRGRGFALFVDYAHTPDGLERVLGTLRGAPAPGGRLLVVFGCGGDRDRGKRAPMGAVANRFADVAIVTSDNPRGEEPGAIIEQIVAGMQPRRAELVVEPERRAAIERAVVRARPGDVVLVAGKGHERVQIERGVERPFDDRQVARELLT